MKWGNGSTSIQHDSAPTHSRTSLDTMPHQHQHHDPHHHSSGRKHDYAKANAEHFDKEAKNQEMVKLGTELAQLSAPHILKYYKFDKDATEVLDFAAGWGMSALALRGFECT